jgi:hypothetical protein
MTSPSLPEEVNTVGSSAPDLTLPASASCPTAIASLTGALVRRRSTAGSTSGLGIESSAAR